MRFIRSKAALFLSAFLFLLPCGGLGLAAQAPAPVSEAAQQKIDQLAKLLSDPDVRALLAERAKQTPAEGAMSGSSAHEYTMWINQIREHLHDVAEAVPLVPAEFEKARETTMAGIDDRRPITVFLFFLLLVAIGRAAEWLFGRVASRIHAHR